jgi:hypothetical protein
MTYGPRANHDNGTLRISRKAESGSTDMNGSFVDDPFTMSTSGTFDSIRRKPVRIRASAFANERGGLAVAGIFEVKKEIGANTMHGTRWNSRTSGFVFEHNTCDVNRVRIKLGTRRDRVKPRLEARDRGNYNVEGNVPCGGIRSGRSRSNIIASGELKEFAKFETAFCDDGMVFFLACVEVSEVRLSGGSRTKLSQDTEDLPASDGANVNVVPQYSAVCCGHGEWHFGQSRVKGLDPNDSISLLRKAKCTKKTFYLEIGVGRPNAHVVTVLVRYTGPLNVEFHVNTIPVVGILEQLAGQRNGSSIWVLCVMNTL